MRVTRLRSLLGIPVVLALIGAFALYGWRAADRYARGYDQALTQELVIHHFERSSWLALNAGKYEGMDPDLARRLRDSAAWHAKRARQFQRMSTGDVAHESEKDAEHDLSDARLLERALRCDSLLHAKEQAMGESEQDGGKARDAPP